MSKNGKVLFYNESDGKGIIITSDKKKVNFSVAEWNDFDTMPSLGLHVGFDLEGDSPVDIVVLDQESTNNQTEDDIKETPEEIAPQETPEEISEEIAFPEEAEEVVQEITPQETVEDIASPEEAQEIVEDISTQESSEKAAPEEETKRISVDVVKPDTSEKTDSDTEGKKTSSEVKDEAQKYLDEYNEEMEREEAVRKENEASQKEAQLLEEQALKEEEAQAEKLEKEEMEEQRNSITITLNISTAVANYFDKIKEHINRRSAYKKVDGKLDYVLIKRFLSTTFNNLVDIDLHIITPKIKALNGDLQEMGGVYEDFTNKTRHPHLAYKEVFLSCQAEYNKVKAGAQYTIEKLKQLQVNETSMGGMLKVKKEELDKNIKTAEFKALQNELKSLNGAYVDVVHMMAELDERYKNDMKLLAMFEDEYREDFYEIFSVEALFYKKKILEILNSQAFIFDAQMWQEAKKSKAVKAHFMKSDISGDMTTKTYLKYYLDTLNADKVSGEQKKLFELYEQLEADNPEYILIVMSSPQDVMEHEMALKQACKAVKIKSFIDEKAALQWSRKNSVKIIIIEDRLQKTTAERFLHVYQKNVFLKPEVIILGQKPKTCPYSINKLFSKSISSRVIIDSVKDILK